jgi:uncharacterized protein YcbX
MSLQLAVFAPAVATLVYKLYMQYKVEEEIRNKQPQVTDIYVYPIKSCHGIRLNSCRIGTTGFEYDRTWMIVDEERKRFVTQRKQAKLATVVTAFKGEFLEVTAPNMEPLKLPLKTNKKATIGVEVWDDKVMAIEEDPKASEWFSTFLGKKVKLVRVDPAAKRIADVKYWTKEMPGAKVVSFADGFPFLVISHESVEFLNQNLSGTSVSFRRFRPNIVVRGAPEAFHEDTWKTFKIRNTIFHAVKDCQRCKITTLDPDTGVSQGEEPLKSLPQIRGGRDAAYFGQNVVHETEGGCVWVGDRVEITPQVFHS